MLPTLPGGGANLAQLTDSPAYKFFARHAGVPEVLRNEVPSPITNRIGRWIYNDLLPALRLSTIEVEQRVYEGTTYYRFTMWQPGRTVRLTTTAFGCYFIGNGLNTLNNAGVFEHLKGDIVLSDEAHGNQTVPHWAIAPLLREFATVVKDNEESVQFLVDEMLRLKALPEVEEQAAPDAASDRVLH